MMLRDQDIESTIESKRTIDQELQEFRKQWKTQGKQILTQTSQDIKNFKSNMDTTDLSLGIEANNIIEALEEVSKT